MNHVDFNFQLAGGRLFFIAEETLTEFLAKATGTAVDWIQMPGMKVSVTIKFVYFSIAILHAKGFRLCLQLSFIRYI